MKTIRLAYPIVLFCFALGCAFGLTKCAPAFPTPQILDEPKPQLREPKTTSSSEYIA